MAKKYQVFVSSTYDDLIEERKAISTALLESDCIPAGMELFPAANASSWSIIKRVIEESDYYLLILAGRYGSFPKSKSRNKTGYTEMEFDYATKLKKPIIALIHNDIGKISSAKVESTSAGKKRLEKFTEKVKSSDHNVSFWDDTASLVSKVKTAIAHQISDEPAPGWVRGNEFDELMDYENLRNAGVNKAYNDVNDIDYRQLIDSAKKEIDIIHIHGMTWTNRNRASLISKLSDSNIQFRIMLLDVGGLFFAPYARFIGKDDFFLFNKMTEVLEMWGDMYNQATENGSQEGADVTIMFHNGIPNKSMYRFDSTIVVNPVTMTRDKTPLMPTYLCTKRTGTNDVFSSYSDEINNLARNSVYSFKLVDFCSGTKIFDVLLNRYKNPEYTH